MDPIGHIDSWSDLALDLLDGTLSAQEAVVLNAHLEDCAACRAALEEQRAMGDLMRAVPQVPVPEELEETVLGRALSRGAADAIGGEITGSSRTARDRRTGGFARLRDLLRPRVWLPAAAFALLLGVAVTSYFGAGLGRDQDLRTAAPADGTKAAAATESDSLGAGADATTTTAAESAADMEATATTAAASVTTTVAAVVPPELSPTAQIGALGAATGADPPVVWVTVTIPAAERGNAALALRSVTDLESLPPQASPGVLPAYAALISTADVDAFTAALGISDLRVLPLAESVGVLPSDVSARLKEGPGALPRLRPATTDDGAAAYGWSASEPDAAGELTGLVVLVVTLSVAD